MFVVVVVVVVDNDGVCWIWSKICSDDWREIFMKLSVNKYKWPTNNLTE